MRTMNHWIRGTVTTVGLVLATGCGPSNANLLAENRPWDAMCRMSSAEEAQAVLPRVLAGVQVEWRFHKLQREDLPSLDDEVARELFERDHVALVDVRLPEGAKKGLVDESIKVTLEAIPSISGAVQAPYGDKLAWVWPKASSSRVSVAIPVRLMLRRSNCVASVHLKLISEPFDVDTADPQRFVPFSFNRWNGDATVRLRAHEFLRGIHVAELTVPSP